VPPGTTPILTNMQIYTVGGAVRDTLLGVPVKDRDYVVVGATPEQMVALGYTPVGSDFPVFLHPQTHEEYALARTERKTAPGYRGFVFHADGAVTLDEDLVRRDLTINAMALSGDGVLVDPFGGRVDLERRLFRHVSDAFIEDPVRILRVARFAARFTEFTVEASTNALMQRMVAAGEVDALVPERVWQELARGLMEAQPSRMFAVLRACGALARLLPEIDRVWTMQHLDDGTTIGARCMHSIDEAARQNLALPSRFAALLCNIEAIGSVSDADPAYQRQQIDALATRLKIPNECRDLALMTVRELACINYALSASATELVALIERCDGLRKPDRFLDMLRVVDCMQRIQTTNPVLPVTRLLIDVLAAARAVDAGEIALRSKQTPALIPQQIRTARIDAVNVAIATIRGADATQ
jgi:tRNA nucleotidyltransferase (CCA-adding enzyme)